MVLYNFNKVLEGQFRWFGRRNQVANELVRWRTDRAEQDRSLLLCSLDIIGCEVFLETFGIGQPVLVSVLELSNSAVSGHVESC